MPLKQHHIDKFKESYKKQYGEEISDDEAWLMAENLINLFKLLMDKEEFSIKESRATKFNRRTGFK